MVMQQDQGKLGSPLKESRVNGMANDGPPSGVPGEDGPDQPPLPMGTMVIRTWNEPHRTPGFRARMTYSHSPTAEPETTYTVDPEEVVDTVRRWLLPHTETQSQS
ncbi:hypothetical protein ARTHRO9AX_150041 [Arthrobacter sp. 9AX]|nr:hypothetical protein ARTHRO9AX_150041 [Arthrobacter sp. 9AX]